MSIFNSINDIELRIDSENLVKTSNTIINRLDTLSHTQSCSSGIDINSLDSNELALEASLCAAKLRSCFR